MTPTRRGRGAARCFYFRSVNSRDVRRSGRFRYIVCQEEGGPPLNIELARPKEYLHPVRSFKRVRYDVQHFVGRLDVLKTMFNNLFDIKAC